MHRRKQQHKKMLKVKYGKKKNTRHSETSKHRETMRDNGHGNVEQCTHYTVSSDIKTQLILFFSR